MMLKTLRSAIRTDWWTFSAGTRPQPVRDPVPQSPAQRASEALEQAHWPTPRPGWLDPGNGPTVPDHADEEGLPDACPGRGDAIPHPLRTTAMIVSAARS